MKKNGEKKKKLSKQNTENCQQKPSRLKSQRDCDALEAIYNAQQTQTLLSHVPKP